MPAALEALLLAVASSQVAVITTSIYLHRSATHRAVRLNRGVELVCRTTIWALTGIRRRPWIAVHRFHHEVADTDLDPHSPRHAGIWKVQLAGAILYRRASRDRVLVERYSPDVVPDRWDALFNRSWLGPTIAIAGVGALASYPVALTAAVLHLVLYLAAQQAVNAWCHPWKGEPEDRGLVDRPILALLTAGEGLHRTHHEAPWLHDYGDSARGFDLGGQVVRILVRARLAVPGRGER